MVDFPLHPRDLLLLLGTEEGGHSRDGGAATEDGEGDDADEEADGRPEHVLDWMQVVGGLLLELVPPCPIQRKLSAEDNRGVPPHVDGGDGDCLALVKHAVTLLTFEPENAGQAVPHCILRTLKNFLHAHLIILLGKVVEDTIVNI